MDFFESLCGSSRCFLCVADFNPRAKVFYERRGYKQVAVLPDLYRTGISENLMMKTL